MEKNNDSKLINHKTQRRIIGIIAFSIAPITWILSDAKNEIGSVSATYWTDAHDIFVGSLVAVGFFLAAYKGAPKTRFIERPLSLIACISALGIALVPTAIMEPNQEPSIWITEIFGDSYPLWHNIFGMSYFGCLIGLMWIFSHHAKYKDAHIRKKFYRANSIVMAIGMGVLWFALDGFMKKTFFVELWGLTLFSVGWFVAGMYKSPKEEVIQN